MINAIADALCQCRFESTYSTTEESVYQYLLDIILNCIRCDAGVLLTKKRSWNLIDTIFNMAFHSSVTPVRPPLRVHPSCSRSPPSARSPTRSSPSTRDIATHALSLLFTS